MKNAEILNVSAEEYHSIKAFSSSVAKTLISRSPAHAHAEVSKTPTRAMDDGTIIHRLLLGKGADYEVVNAANYLTKDAKAKRDAIREAGKVPVLVDDLESHSLAAESIRLQLADRGIVLDGQSELAITWQEQTEFGPVQCKGMLDHAWVERGLILDLKVTADASPMKVERTSEDFGYAIQWAAYTRALVALDPSLIGRVGMAFAFCEKEVPYAINVAEPDGVFREIGTKRWLRAVTTWAKCTAEGAWPSYGTTVNPLTAPSWALAREAA